MDKKIIFLSVVTYIFLLVGFVPAGAQMNPGKWKITTTTEMAGMPSQSATHTQCITSDDLIPMSQDASQECQISDIKKQGNTVSWKIACGGGSGKMNGTGVATYNGDTMNGTMNMTIVSHGTKVKNKISGRRIGPCDGQTSTSTSATSAQPAATTQETKEPSEVEKEVTEDVKDVGKAAKDEAKQGVINEVRDGVRGAIRDLFH